MKIGPPPKASCARLVAAMEWRRGGNPAETRRQAIPRFDVFLCGKGMVLTTPILPRHEPIAAQWQG